MTTPLEETVINVPERELHELVAKTKDWALMHGAGMRRRCDPVDEDSLSFAPFTLLPSSLSRKEFNKAIDVQTTLNELTHRIAYHPSFLEETLANTINVDDFTTRLLSIYQRVKKEGIKQPISLGLVRSDYLTDSAKSDNLKQVEINTIASSFGCLSNKVLGLHRFVLQQLGLENLITKLPENKALSSLSGGILEAWTVFNNPSAVILFLVEEVTRNICDQRFLEFEIESMSNWKARVVRRSLRQVGEEGHLKDGDLYMGKDCVAVIYMRSGYDPSQYPSDLEWEARLLMERSRAIKCPSIQYHLAGTKKVQQVLSKEGVVEELLGDVIKAQKVREIFTNLYSLDNDQEGKEGLKLGLESPEKYVLKPQREGGGNNVYGAQIKEKLESLSPSERSSWILMERIFPRQQPNWIVRPGVEMKLTPSPVVSELGIFGVILGDENRILKNSVAGHMLRTKLSSADEGGVASGVGALDSPYLLEA